MASIIQWRRDLAANWTAANPILAQGETGLELDTGLWKNGDGTTPWNSLTYIGTGPPGADGPQGPQGDPGEKGDKGDPGSISTDADNVLVAGTDSGAYYAGPYLDDVLDVDVSAATQGEYLYYDAASGTWKSKISVSALGIIEFDYRWSTAPDAVPSSGRISSNNVNPDLVTLIYVNEISTPGNDLTLFWDNISTGDWLNINAPGAYETHNSYDVTGPPVKNGSVYTIPVTVFDVTPYLPGNNNQVAVFLRFGVNTGGVGVETIVAGTGIAVDATDPANPVVSSTVTQAVSSVFNRTGAVAAQSGDYSVYYLGINATAVAATTALNLSGGSVSATSISASGTIQGANGSASSPSFGFSGDPDNGMYRVTTNTLGLSAGGALRMSLSSAGVAGVWNTGTSSNSNSKLSVVSALPGTPDANTIYFVTG